jgi:hypothetical protein
VSGLLAGLHGRSFRCGTAIHSDRYVSVSGNRYEDEINGQRPCHRLCSILLFCPKHFSGHRTPGNTFLNRGRQDEWGCVAICGMDRQIAVSGGTVRPSDALLLPQSDRDLHPPHLVLPRHKGKLKRPNKASAQVAMTARAGITDSGKNQFRLSAKTAGDSKDANKLAHVDSLLSRFVHQLEFIIQPYRSIVY